MKSDGWQNGTFQEQNEIEVEHSNLQEHSSVTCIKISSYLTAIQLCYRYMNHFLLQLSALLLQYQYGVVDAAAAS